MDDMIALWKWLAPCVYEGNNEANSPPPPIGDEAGFERTALYIRTDA